VLVASQRSPRSTTTPCSRDGGLRLRAPSGRGGLVVLLGDRRLDMPGWLEPAMRMVASSDTITSATWHPRSPIPRPGSSSPDVWCGGCSSSTRSDSTAENVPAGAHDPSFRCSQASEAADEPLLAPRPPSRTGSCWSIRVHGVSERSITRVSRTAWAPRSATRTRAADQGPAHPSPRARRRRAPCSRSTRVRPSVDGTGGPERRA
jgi:hypothetical protein